MFILIIFQLLAVHLVSSIHRNAFAKVLSNLVIVYLFYRIILVVFEVLVF